MRGFEDFIAVDGNQGFIGCNNVLTCGDGFEYQILRYAITTNQLNHDINLGVCNDRTGIANNLCAITD